jgi:hypothetical protein
MASITEGGEISIDGYGRPHMTERPKSPVVGLWLRRPNLAIPALEELQTSNIVGQTAVETLDLYAIDSEPLAASVFDLDEKIEFHREAPVSPLFGLERMDRAISNFTQAVSGRSADDSDFLPEAMTSRVLPLGRGDLRKLKSEGLTSTLRGILSKFHNQSCLEFLKQNPL